MYNLYLFQYVSKSFIGEFLHEVEGARKLLNAIPNSVLDYKPNKNLEQNTFSFLHCRVSLRCTTDI